jgi:hypothetical protein
MQWPYVLSLAYSIVLAFIYGIGQINPSTIGKAWFFLTLGVAFNAVADLLLGFYVHKREL